MQFRNCLNQNRVSKKRVEWLTLGLEKNTARQRPLLRGDHQVSEHLHGGLFPRRGEVIGQRLTAPPQARCMDLIAGDGTSLVAFILVQFFLAFLSLCSGCEGQGGGWAERLAKWGV